MNTILTGDCVEVLRKLPAGIAQCCITDPPYGLGFMGKEWDTLDRSQFGRKGTEGERDLKVLKDFDTLPRFTATQGAAMQEWHARWLAEVYRVLMPGAPLLAFGGTRTFHRLVCAAEDTGFEVRDTLCWLYGSGFPKAQDLGAMIDKAAGVEREVVGRKMGNTHGTDEYEGGWGINEGKNIPVTAPATELAREWDGWKVGGLKPAWEPILLARKPCEGSTVANVLKYGVGAFNADAGRVGTGREKGQSQGQSQVPNRDANNINYYLETLGRFPPNLLLDDDAAAMLDEMSGETTSSDRPRHNSRTIGDGNIYNSGGALVTYGYNDIGGASRFFPRFSYTAKACRWEREAGLGGFEEMSAAKIDGGEYRRSGEIAGVGKDHRDVTSRNPHPTVKPIRLMRWLIELFTREGQVVLDPLAGSGSTCCAAAWAGRRYIGIEKEPDYAAIAQARVQWWAQQYGKSYEDCQRQWEAESAPSPLFEQPVV